MTKANGRRSRVGGRLIDLATFTAAAMTVNEAARLLTVSRGTIEKWCENGDLEQLAYPGGMRRITTASVRALLRKASRTLS